MQASSHKYRIALIGVLLIVAILQIFGALGDSQTIDEGAHLASGYSYWKTGDFRLNPEHPPLSKMLSSAPLLLLNLQFPSDAQSWIDANQWDFARDFLYHNLANPQSLFFLGRLPIIGLFLLLIAVFYFFCEKLFSPRASLLASILFSLDPTLLAHGRLITTDVSLTAFYFFSTIALLGFVQKPNLRRFFLFAFTFTIAQLVKFSALFLWPIFLTLVLIALFIKKYNRSYISEKFTAKRALLLLLGLILLFAISTWTIYGFELRTISTIPSVEGYYDLVDMKGFEEASGALVGIPFWENVLNPTHSSSQSIRNFVHTVPIPALHYFDGIMELALHNYYGHGTYLLGKTSNLGWWYYFPIALIIKLPAVILLLFLLFLFWQARQAWLQVQTSAETHPFFTRVWHFFRSRSFLSYLLVLPPLIYFLVSLTSHINLGVRHLLPIFPFIYLAVAFMLDRVLLRFFYGKIITGILFGIVLIMAVLTYPNHLSYFSEIVGGERNGPKYLLDSNLDWGQGYYDLKEYMDEKQIDAIRGVFFFSGDLDVLGIHLLHLPTNDEVAQQGAPSGILAIDVGTLANPDYPYTWLWQYQPVKKIRGSIFIYELP